MARRFSVRTTLSSGWRGIIHHATTPGTTIPFGYGVAVGDWLGVAVAGWVGMAVGVAVAGTVGSAFGVAVAGTVGSAFGVDPGFGFDPGVTGFGVAVGVQVGLGVGVAVPAGPGVAGQVFGVNVLTTPDIVRFGAAGIAIEDALKAR